jgi:hypothetical protein
MGIIAQDKRAIHIQNQSLQRHCEISYKIVLAAKRRQQIGEPPKSPHSHLRLKKGDLKLSFIPPFKGENLLKVPFITGDARGISTDINEANKL